MTENLTYWTLNKRKSSSSRDLEKEEIEQNAQNKDKLQICK